MARRSFARVRQPHRAPKALPTVAPFDIRADLGVVRPGPGPEVLELVAKGGGGNQAIIEAATVMPYLASGAMRSAVCYVLSPLRQPLACA